MQHLGIAHKSPGQYSTDTPVIPGSQPHRYYLCRSLWKCFYLNWVWHLRRVFTNGPWHYQKWLFSGPFLSLFLILAFQFAVVAMWFGEKKTTLCETTEESWSFVMGKWCKSFISKEARWSERECKILRGLRRDAEGCHWLAVTFSLMVMTFCSSWRACVCSCRWLWDSVKLSHSKVKKNKDKHFSWSCLTVTGHSTNTTPLCLLLFKPGNQ